MIALEARNLIIFDALGQALALAVPDEKTLHVAALEQFEAWQEVSGYIEERTSLYVEVWGCIEEAFRLGVVAGRGERP